MAPRISFLGKTAPKKNKRGKRSKEKQEERVLKGLHKRQEAQQARAEARFPELLGRSSSTEGQARTVVLEGDSVERPRKRVRRTEKRHRGVVLRERVAGSPAPVPAGSTAVAAGSTAPQEKKKRRRRRKTLQGVPRIQLRSVARPRQNLNLAGLKLSSVRRQWDQQSFRERVAAKQQIRRLLPRGTVGESLLTVPAEACSSCDERTRKNRPVASAFALRRLRREPLPELPGAFPEVPEQEIQEEEEEEIPLLDSPDRDGPKRSNGDGESTDSEDCNYRSSNQYPAELRAC